MPEAPWMADSRRPSHTQEALIRYALDTAGEGPLPPSWLGCAFDLPAGLDADAFAAALRNWTDRHETLRSQLMFSAHSTPDSRLLRVTLPPGTVTIYPSEATNFRDSRKLAQYIENLFDREIGPLGWPGYICATISNADATTVCVVADHTLIDGYSILGIPHEIHTLYAAALATSDSKPAPPLPPTASYLDFAETERNAADALTIDHESVISWQQFVTKVGGHLPVFPEPVSAQSGNPTTAQPGGHAELLDASSARTFDQVCRAAGGATFSGLLSCLAKVGHEITGSGEFRTMVPFHTQTGPWRSSIGWFVGMGPVAFSLSATSSFAETVRSAVAGLNGVKELAQIPLPRVAELLGQPLRDPFMISYMDLRRTPGARNWNTWRAIALRSRCTDPDEVCLWVWRNYDGLFVSYRHPATDLAGIAVPRYVARTKQLLAVVADTSCWLANPHSKEECCS
ncbi:condensation domain-containing protein [Paraburkholderia atlantica]